MNLKKTFFYLFLVFTVFSFTTPASYAFLGMDDDDRRDTQVTNIVRTTAVGAGIGAAAGAVSGESSILKGAVVGAGTGAVVGGVDQVDALQQRPLARRVVKGSAIGAGTNIILGNSILGGAVIGGAAGALYHTIKKRGLFGRECYDTSGIRVDCP
jgi:hypothetical protein